MMIVGKKRVLASVLCAVLVAASLAVWSSAGSATTPTGLTMTPLGRGSLPDDVRVNNKTARVRTNVPADLFVMQLTIAPGGDTGWHGHPGPVMVVVKTGEVISYDDDCAPHAYAAGQAFLDKGINHDHIMRNTGSVTAELLVTAILPRAEPLRIDRPAPTTCF